MNRIYHRYMWILAAVFAGMLATVICFNVIVDPYGVWRIVERQGFNAAKPTRRDQNYMFKAVDLARRTAPVLLYGSSRVAFGLDPDSADESLGCRGCSYNAALTGGHMKALHAYLMHTLEQGAPLEHVIWGIDFFAFDRGTRLAPVFDPTRLNHFGMSANDAIFAATGLATTWRSLRTVGANATPPVDEPYSDDGHLTAADMREQVARVGMRQRFRRSLDLYLNGRFTAYQPSAEAWRLFDDALRRLRERGVKVTVFVPPTHAVHLEALRLRGLWDCWSAFKRRLAEHTAYWDFSGTNPVTAEPIRDTMDHYWDISHFRASVGERILTQITGADGADMGFGQRIRADNVDTHLAAARRALAAWREHNPDDAAFVRERMKTGTD